MHGSVTIVIDNTVLYNRDLQRKENLSILSKEKEKNVAVDILTRGNPFTMYMYNT